MINRRILSLLFIGLIYIQLLLACTTKEVGVWGIFVSKWVVLAFDQRCYDVLKFYDDGLVISGGLCTKSTIEEDLPNFTWFDRNSTGKELLRGEYYITGDKIQFTLKATDDTGEENVIDYSGKYLGEQMILDSISHLYPEASRENQEFVRLKIK